MAQITVFGSGFRLKRLQVFIFSSPMVIDKDGVTKMSSSEVWWCCDETVTRGYSLGFLYCDEDKLVDIMVEECSD